MLLLPHKIQWFLLYVCKKVNYIRQLLGAKRSIEDQLNKVLISFPGFFNISLFGNRQIFLIVFKFGCCFYRTFCFS